MEKVGDKVVVVGTGSVGVSYAYSVPNQVLCDSLILIDLNRKCAEDKAHDFRHGMPYAALPARVYIGDYDNCSDADVVYICAGLPQRPGETRLDLADNDLRVFHSIVTAVMVSGFDGIFLVTTNPADVLSYATWRFSGLPKEHVIGSGTIIDSARFCSRLGNEFNVTPWSVDTMMIGKHGDSVTTVQGTANISGMPVKKILGQEESDKARMKKVYSNMRNAAHEVIETKDLTNHGIRMGSNRISNAILHNQGMMLSVSSLLEDEFGQGNAYIGVPTVVGRQGAVRIINLDLSGDEAEQFARSAGLLKSYRRKVDDFMATR